MLTGDAMSATRGYLVEGDRQRGLEVPPGFRVEWRITITGSVAIRRNAGEEISISQIPAMSVGNRWSIGGCIWQKRSLCE